ncbi:ABC transporter substrate-binding protein [Desulfosporosinus sp. PR]|uniref:ABC transporter substrate-binding protein n=1 Tax=Candidatus Desulfosporosinus nitrosoreducens TaxID=3401928 RepID=UPI0027ECACE9|nr:ABC transporter substrate-binding protein [Desulfosporosinus sp. PR]MDQ7092834.1 ABC transporter substrate-binding protein [Desulfosporosinus sp. PR]
MKKFINITASLVLVAGLLAGCGTGGGNSSASSQPEKLTKMRVAYMPNMGSASTLVTGINMGYFKQEGIDVELVQFAKGPDEIAAMGSGNIDVSQIGHGAHTLAAKGQADIITIDDTSLADAVMGNKDKGINTIADLKGKTIGTSLGTSSQVILDLALASAGMTEKDVKVVQMDPSAAVTAMVTGNIDACAIWSPSTITVKQKMGDKVVTLADNNTYKDQLQFPSSFVVTPAYAEKNKDLLVHFTSALFKAMDYRADKKNIKQVADWVAAQVKQDPALMEQGEGEGNWLTSKYVYDSVNDGTLKKIYENQQALFIKNKQLPAAVNVDNYVLYDNMKAAYEANNKTSK